MFFCYNCLCGGNSNIKILYRYRGFGYIMNELAKKVASVALGTSLLFTSVTGASAATYTVKKGDTFTKIAQQYGTSYQSIMSQNGLKSTVILVGQKLQIGSAASTSTASKTSASVAATNNSNIVSTAKQYLGVRYIFGGSSLSGFDCSGFVYYVMKKTGKSISRTSAASYYNMSTKVSSPKVGDLVFFSNTYKKGISHVGIYIGNGQMISASGINVNIASVNSTYWGSHFTGYGRI